MAGRQRHAFNLAGVPCTHDEAAAVGIFLDLLDDAVDLINGASIRCTPLAPLRAVHAPEVAFRICPFVPDRHAVLLQPANVRFAAQEPEQLVNDRLEMQLLRREQRKTFAQIEPRLRAKNRERAGAGTVGLGLAPVENEAKQFVVFAHRKMLQKQRVRCRCKSRQNRQVTAQRIR